MNDFFEKIKFQYINLSTKKNFKYKIYKSIRKKLNKNDVINLKTKLLDKSQHNFLEKLYSIHDSAHMSTPAIGLMINYICKNLKKNETFLNIGAYRGFTTICGMINTVCTVHSVDNFSEFDGPKAKDIFFKNFNLFKGNNHFFHENDYELFFKSWHDPIKFYIYDALHSYEQQYKNLIIARDFFVKDTIIYVDDYNVDAVENGTKDFLSKYPNEFEIIKEIKTPFNTHPTYWNGFILFKKK